MKDFKFIVPPSGNEPVNPDENDFVFEDGKIIMVEGHDRKLQDTLKILMTALGTNPVFPMYGSTLPAVAGTRDIDANDKISEGIKEAIAFLVEVEESRFASERIAGIRKLVIRRDPDDAETRIIRIVIALQDGQNIEFVRRI